VHLQNSVILQFNWPHNLYNTSITNDIRYTNQTQQNLLFSTRSSEWQHISAETCCHSLDLVL